MTQKDTTTLKGKIAVMQAYEMGREVQVRYRNGVLGWQNSKSPEWDWLNYEYRIKPKPQEWQLRYRPDLGVVEAVRVSPGQDVGGARVREVGQ